MPILSEQGPQSRSIHLQGAVDIATASELKAALQEALERKEAIHLSLAEITCLDITAVQLLWAAERAARSASVPLEVEGRLKEELVAMLRGVGFEGFPLS